MIAMLRGCIAALGEDCAVVDVGGVGWRVFVPPKLLSTLQPGDETRFWVSTQVREDAIHLYGFESVADRDTFLLLLGVSGVGPRTALAILSDVGRRDLATAVVRGDPGPLQRAAGVGKRLAQRLVVDLAGKTFPAAEIVTSEIGSVPPPQVASDPLSLALAQLGYRKSEIDRALSVVAPSDGPTALDERLRAALRVLAGGSI
jgi:holliday junction DNA helicase RuvA